MRRALTQIELLVVIAIIAVLVGLLLPAIQRAREAASRIRCENNLKQFGIAAHGYHNANYRFPPGSSGPPSRLSVQGALLPFLDQQRGYELFDLTTSAHGTPGNYKARIQKIPFYLCPSDGSGGFMTDEAPPVGTTPEADGRCNYYGNAGAHGWFMESSGSLSKPSRLTGAFGLNSTVSTQAITDGCSNTVLFSEVLRGAAPNRDRFDVTVISTWGSNPPTNPNNFGPIDASLAASCDAAASTINVTGLQYYRGNAHTSLYTHTVPPNYTGRDCINFLGDQFHLAARSRHDHGVNGGMADGSVRFLKDSIAFEVWKAYGTRSGDEIPAE